MNFEELTGQIGGAIVKRPGHRDDGKRFDHAISSMTRMRSWGANYGGYTWVISYEPGISTWSAAEKKEHIGYTASYRKHGTDNFIKIDGGPWDTMTKAEEACSRVWRSIRNAN